MSRTYAVGAHLLISLLILAVLTALLVFVWFPGIYYETDGGWQGFRIILIVDIVLGPLLTLVVYKPGKPGLQFDLAVIAVLQISALTAGTLVVYNERPLALIYSDYRFFTLSRGDFSELDLAVPDFSRFPGPTPKQLAVQLPQDPEALAQARSRYFENKQPLRTADEFYVPMQAARELILSESFGKRFVRDNDPEKFLEQWLADHPDISDRVRFMPVATRYVSRFAALHPDSGDIVDVLPIQAPLNLPTQRRSQLTAE